MNVLILPDKFKNSLSAFQVVDSVAKGIKKKYPDANILSQALSDGGEGSIEIIKASSQGLWQEVSVSDPLFRPIQASYFKTDHGAFIEMSLASGLKLLEQDEFDCFNATSYGTGQLIADTLDKGLSEIYLFIGGSATNDLGIGMATALGYQFFDRLGNEVLPIGKNMQRIVKISSKNIHPRLQSANIHLIYDVDNPLFGHFGAAYMYAGQKGANPTQILELDNGLRHLALVIQKELQKEISASKGAGAAGGMGAGAFAFLGAEAHAGIDFFINRLGIEEEIKNADIVITGEGSVDSQTWQGKVIAGVHAACKRHEKRLVVLCGRKEAAVGEPTDIEIHDILSIAKSEADAMENAGKYLTQLAQTIEVI